MNHRITNRLGIEKIGQVIIKEVFYKTYIKEVEKLVYNEGSEKVISLIDRYEDFDVNEINELKILGVLIIKKHSQKPARLNECSPHRRFCPNKLYHRRRWNWQKKLYDENGNEVKRKRGGCLKTIGIIVIVFIAFVVIAALFSDGSDSTSPETEPDTTTSSASEAESTSEEETTAEETTEDVPREFENALGSAQSYIDGPFSFSESGLSEQLEFEEFPQEAIDYALENVDVDYNQQAVEAAQKYADSEFNMSDQGIIDQLLFEGFTQEQTEHGLSSLN